MIDEHEYESQVICVPTLLTDQEQTPIVGQKITRTITIPNLDPLVTLGINCDERGGTWVVSVPRHANIPAPLHTLSQESVDAAMPDLYRRIDEDRHRASHIHRLSRSDRPRPDGYLMWHEDGGSGTVGWIVAKLRRLFKGRVKP